MEQLACSGIDKQTQYVLYISGGSTNRNEQQQTVEWAETCRAHSSFSPRPTKTETCRATLSSRQQHQFKGCIIDHFVASVICNKAILCPFTGPGMSCGSTIPHSKYLKDIFFCCKWVIIYDALWLWMFLLAQLCLLPFFSVTSAETHRRRAHNPHNWLITPCVEMMTLELTDVYCWSNLDFLVHCKCGIMIDYSVGQQL